MKKHSNVFRLSLPWFGVCAALALAAIVNASDHWPEHRGDMSAVAPSTFNTLTVNGLLTANGGVALPDRTVENLTISVNPTTGTDFTTPTTINKQAQFTAHGAFASYKGAVAALPSHIGHKVTITHSAGTFTGLPVDYFGNLSRLTFDADVFPNTTEIGLLFSAPAFVKSAGSGDLTFSSSVGGYTITMAADPGYVADTYRGKWLQVVSGTGAAETNYRAIRSHNGAVFEVAGYFPSLSGTSVFNIVEPATNLVATTSFVLKGANQIGSRIIEGGGAYVYVYSITIGHLGLSSATNDFVNFYQIWGILEGTIINTGVVISLSLIHI